MSRPFFKYIFLEINSSLHIKSFSRTFLQIMADFRQDSSTQMLLQMYLSFSSTFVCVSVRRMLHEQN